MKKSLVRKLLGNKPNINDNHKKQKLSSNKENRNSENINNSGKDATVKKEKLKKAKENLKTKTLDSLLNQSAEEKESADVTTQNDELLKINKIIETKKNNINLSETDKWFAKEIVTLIEEEKFPLVQVFLELHFKKSTSIHDMLKYTSYKPVMSAANKGNYDLIEYFLKILDSSRLKFLLVSHNNYEIINKFVNDALLVIKSNDRHKIIKEIFEIFLAVKPLDIKEKIDALLLTNKQNFTTAKDLDSIENLEKIKQMSEEVYSSAKIQKIINTELNSSNTNELEKYDILLNGELLNEAEI